LLSELTQTTFCGELTSLTSNIIEIKRKNAPIFASVQKQEYYRGVLEEVNYQLDDAMPWRLKARGQNGY
jgi:hypothetical protein